MYIYLYNIVKQMLLIHYESWKTLKPQHQSGNKQCLRKNEIKPTSLITRSGRWVPVYKKPQYKQHLSKHVQWVSYRSLPSFLLAMVIFCNWNVVIKADQFPW